MNNVERMKYSIYNSLIDVSERTVLLYNSFSDSFFILNRSIKRSLKEPLLIKEKDLQLYRQLVSKGIYVPERINEFERLKKYTKETLLDETTYFLIVNPTMNCNLQCWYCYEKHSTSYMSDDIYNRVTLLIKKILNEKVSIFTLGFFGGEPLMEYKSIIIPLIDFAKNKCNERNIKLQLTFTSNGTLLTKQMIEELCKYANPSFQITLDGDESAHNKVRYFKNQRGTYHIILQNVKLLLSNKCHVMLRFNYTKETIETIWNAINEIKKICSPDKEYLTIDFHRVWQDKDNNRMLNSVKLLADNLADNGFTVKCSDLNEIKDACYGDRKNTAIINYNGDVFKCTARDFTTENRDGYLDKAGHIVWIKSQEYRLSLKLKNSLCQSCRIAPLCGGGCSRYILEREKFKQPYCLFNQNEDEIDDFVINHIQHIIREQKLES